MQDSVVINRGGKRDSGIELLRILSMLVIVAHHYVVNSGVLGRIDQQNMITGNSVFAILFGWGGKTGINCFILITGYFMCISNITLKKFLKLLMEIEFYRVIIYLVFVCSGYQMFNMISFIKAVLPVKDISTAFTSSYLVFFLFIPFLNLLIHAMNKKQHLTLIGLTVGIYSIWASLGFNVSFNYVTWFSVLYVIAAYIRMYPLPLFENKTIWAVLSIASIVVSWSNVVVLMFIAQKIGKALSWSYYFVNDCNKVLALITGLCTFMFFKNLHFYSKSINSISAATFGVLLIHANGDVMRQWLWKDTLNNVGVYGTNVMVLHAIISVLAIYIICTVIDILRINFIERPVMKLLLIS